tara:strand:- start:20877 stop:21077 length:201 start_codon:yes stop_codon:yes gene_type:complete
MAANDAGTSGHATRTITTSGALSSQPADLNGFDIYTLSPTTFVVEADPREFTVEAESRVFIVGGRQ